MADGGRLVIAHAGMREHLQNRTSHAVRDFGLYGDTTGGLDEDGHPVRRDWGKEYRGEAYVVYEHTPVAAAEWVDSTICIDTGCAFGGKLTALRWPERELVEVDALATYADPPRTLVEERGRRSTGPTRCSTSKT